MLVVEKLHDARLRGIMLRGVIRVAPRPALPDDLNLHTIPSHAGREVTQVNRHGRSTAVSKVELEAEDVVRCLGHSLGRAGAVKAEPRVLGQILVGAEA